MKKYDVAIVTDIRRYLGFRLASYPNIFAVSTIDEGNKLIKKLFEDTENNYGLILVSSHVYNSEDPQIKKLTRKTFPLLVEIPISDKSINIIEENKIIEYLRKSIGISIKF